MEISPVEALAMLVILKNLFKAEVALESVHFSSVFKAGVGLLFLSYLPPVIQDNE